MPESTAQIALQNELAEMQQELEKLQLKSCDYKREIAGLRELLASLSPDQLNGERPQDDAEAVVAGFRRWLKLYHMFKSKHNLPHTSDDPKDIALAMTGKHGRIMDHVKHVERDDPKPDWKFSVEESMMGYLAYMVMLCYHYDIQLKAGLRSELLKGIEQHSVKPST